MSARAPIGAGKSLILWVHRRLRGCSASTSTSLVLFDPTSAAAVQSGAAPSGLDDEETRNYEKLKDFFATDAGYAIESATHPQALYGIADSPVGLAAWMLDHDATSMALISRVFGDEAQEGLTRRRARQHHPLLVDEHGGLCGTPLLGRQGQLLRPDDLADRRRLSDRGHPGGRERLPRRDLLAAAELGGGGLSQAHPLQQARQGRALRRLGAAGPPLRRGPHGAPLIALGDRVQRLANAVVASAPAVARRGECVGGRSEHVLPTAARHRRLGTALLRV